LLGVFSGIAFAVLGAVLPAWRASRMRPNDAIRAEADITGGHIRKRTEKGTAVNRCIPSWLHLSLRNIIQNRRRALLTGLAIMMTVAMITSLSATMRSVSYSLDQYFDEVLSWDVRVVFRNPQPPSRLSDISAIDGVEIAEPGLVFPAHVVSESGSADVEMQALPDTTVMHDDLEYGGKDRWPGAGEAVLQKGLEGRLGAKPGEKVTIQTELGAVDVKVAGYIDELFGNVGYVNLEYVRGIVGADVFNNVYLSVSPSKEKEVYSAVIRAPGIAKAVTMTQMKDYGDVLADVLLTLGNLLLYMGFFIGLAIIFTMVSINVLERSRELGTMRTIGAGGGLIFGLLNIETLLICIMAFLPGIIIGRVLEWFLIKTLSSDILSATSKLSVELVLIMFAGLLMAVFLSELLPFRGIMRLDLAKATRERQG
ncbi:MAG: ABC transporter permease, partial [Actinobacteria bacterium]|nr:ABC transporter permease [Actinomycetota bacterium]